MTNNAVYVGGGVVFETKLLSVPLQCTKFDHGLYVFIVCKFVSIEMKSAFEETGKTKEVIETNYRFLDDKGAPPIKYVKS